MRQYYCDNLALVGQKGWLISYIEDGEINRKPYWQTTNRQDAEEITNELNREELKKLKNIPYFKKGWF